MKTWRRQRSPTAVLPAALLLLALLGTVQAQFTYTTNGGTITITGYTGPGGAVDIPGTINGRFVTALSASAFEYETGLSSVTIPDTVISIGHMAFQWCTSLATVAIGRGVTSLGESAFLGCTSLTTITVDTANSAYRSVDGVLFDKSQTTLIQYPPAKVGNCPVPKTVTRIAPIALAGCAGLTSIDVDPANSAYCSVNGVLFDKSQTTLVQCPGGKAGQYAVPAGVSDIAGYAFAYCSRLTGITIPDTVSDIGYYAFGECWQLERVTIPNSVTNLGDCAFMDDVFLTHVRIGDGVTNIGNSMFSDCRSLTNVIIGRSVSRIGADAFQYCISLANITIPSGVKEIVDEAFSHCLGLTGVFFQGHAPLWYQSAFTGDLKAIAYYLPGTTGWTPMFSHLPTRLWNPQVRTSDPNFGIRSNRFGFTIVGTADIPVVVDACTNLANPVWISLQGDTLTDGAWYFADSDWTNHQARFYRLRTP